MLLRRVMSHIREQNWFAVGIDLVIVVVGVFIGIQVANWNDVQNNKSGLVASLERLDKEVTLNIEIMDEVLDHFGISRERLNLGREALQSCEESTAGKDALELSLFDFVDDIQPNFASVALDQLASQDRYQDLLSAKFQDDFGRYALRLKEEHEQLTSHYDNMWSHHVSKHPDVTAVFPSEDSVDYDGWGFRLTKPFAEVCADASFRNRYINTVGFYTSIDHRVLAFKQEAQQFRAELAEELQRLSSGPRMEKQDGT